jgi:hypothetical protein
MQRLFTQAEIGLHMDIIRDFIVDEFGEENCSSLAHWLEYYARGHHLREVYGEFPATIDKPPIVLGAIACSLISYTELAALKRGEQKDTGIEPWKPEDGPAIIWIFSVVSVASGVAAKCISAMIDRVQASPACEMIDRMAVFCTGPQGYLMSAAFGLEPDGVSYEDGWPFMERKISASELSGLGRALQEIWTMTKAKDVVKSARSLWGHDWRQHVLEAREYARGNR